MTTAASPCGPGSTPAGAVTATSAGVVPNGADTGEAITMSDANEVFVEAAAGRIRVVLDSAGRVGEVVLHDEALSMAKVELGRALTVAFQEAQGVVRARVAFEVEASPPAPP